MAAADAEPAAEPPPVATPLTETERQIIARHIEGSGLADGVRVAQWPGTASVYYAATGRLWVHRDTARKETLQEFYFQASDRVAPCLTATHALKFWDLGRRATPREMARVQGFPDTFALPAQRAGVLFGNAVAVGCATHAVRCVVAADEARVTHVDMCAGIGGFTLAARAACAGVVGVGYSEVRADACECYARNFPGVPALGDATRVATWPACDLLTAGFPCQPFSNAASKAARGQHAKRDFFEVVLHALRETRATRCVLENVPTLPRVGGDRWDAMLASLRDDLGFAVDTAVLDAHDFGMPQRRRRLYLVARRGAAPLPLGAHAPQLPRPTLPAVLEAVAWPSAPADGALVPRRYRGKRGRSA